MTSQIPTGWQVRRLKAGTIHKLAAKLRTTLLGEVLSDS